MADLAQPNAPAPPHFDDQHPTSLQAPFDSGPPTSAAASVINADGCLVGPSHMITRLPSAYTDKYAD
ncbi:hypothetical protein BST37_19570 [Mycobacterium noviomagense]|uniref:Uncharacterized protein n=1 Tax=Mycobacterium noviomagense TaxID=459858 RepID=A0ABX3T2U6_9MYCO|nr:hypothetical protein BST37_19570 [Mycobacterium noviomagense]